MSPRRALQALLLLAVLVAAGVRLSVDRPAGKPARGSDEWLYLDTAGELAMTGPLGLRRQVQRFLSDPRRWIFPSPLRYGHYLTAAAAVRAWGEDASSLVRVSLLASVAAVVLVALLARRVDGLAAALVAVGLLVADPLWLHLGRRALVDAHHAALFLGATWAFLEAARPDARPWVTALAVALLGWFVAVKENGVVLLAALGALSLARAAREPAMRRVLPRALVTLAGAGALAYVGFSVLAGSPWAYLRIADAMGRSAAHNPYLHAVHGGPPHRYLVDLAALSPVVVLLAPFGVARWLRSPAAAAARPGAAPRAELAWSLAALAIIYVSLLALASLGPGANVRWLLPVDMLLRIALGAWLASWALHGATDRARLARAAVVAGVVVVNAVVEGWIFRRVFSEGRVYDPTTVEVLRALGMIR